MKSKSKTWIGVIIYSFLLSFCVVMVIVGVKIKSIVTILTAGFSGLFFIFLIGICLYDIWNKWKDDCEHDAYGLTKLPQQK